MIPAFSGNFQRQKLSTIQQITSNEDDHGHDANVMMPGQCYTLAMSSFCASKINQYILMRSYIEGNNSLKMFSIHIKYSFGLLHLTLFVQTYN